MLKYLKKYWLFAILAPLFMVGEVLADLVQPRLMSTIVDEGVLGLSNNGVGNLNLVLTEGLKMIIFVILGGLSGILCGVCSNIASQNFGNDLRKDAFKKIMSFSFEQTDKFSTGSLITRVTNDITQLQNFIQMSMRGFIRTFMLFAGGIICMLSLNLSFGAVIACALPLVTICVIYFLSKANPLFSKLQQKLDNVNNVMQENVSGFRVVKAYVKEDGNIAGPRVLEHMVDTVLYLEGERYFAYRILRGVKNRFGSTNEIGMFEMNDIGMCEIDNPSSVLLSEKNENVAGSIVVASIEGTRPILVELQALTATSVFGMPRRTANGIDYNRLTLLIAVLEKRTGLPLGNQDVYLNIVGGIKINEPALDLGIILAVSSSFKNIPIPNDVIAIGEVGLTGEVRSVNQIEKRIKEAEKLGFKKCIIPESNKKLLKDTYKLDIIGVQNISEAMRCLELKR